MTDKERIKKLEDDVAILKKALIELTQYATHDVMRHGWVNPLQHIIDELK